MQPEQWQLAFLERQQLGVVFLDTARHWFEPWADALASHRGGARGPLIVGVNGCQGSGKSTFCDYVAAYLNERRGVAVTVLSLDDFYLTQVQRQQLAAEVHPLFATRGVPGTHDIPLLLNTLKALSVGGEVSIPRFDKASDDRLSREQWGRVTRPTDLILLEGWCLGATAQGDAALAQPCNVLESDEDSEGLWRRTIDRQLANAYPAVNSAVHHWVMLQAPHFGCVMQWRLEQEQKLQARNPQAKTVMTEEQISRFVLHSQRITEHCLLTLPAQVDDLFTLNAQRRIVGHSGVNPLGV